MPRLFVYGTLRRGHPAAHLLQGATFLSKAFLHGTVIERSGYPGLIPGNEIILGELFEIPETLFPPLDHYEGPGYQRRVTDIHLQNEEPTTAWVYWLR